METFRDSAAGYLVYRLSGRRLLRHIEDTPDFVVPAEFLPGYVPPSPRPVSNDSASTVADQNGEPASKEIEKGADQDLEKPRTRNVGTPHDGGEHGAIAQAIADERADGRMTDDNGDYIVVDWYGPDDPANPQNWSLRKKYWVLGVLCWLTFVVYMAASVVSPGIPLLIEQYGVSEVVSSLTIALYVLGYGLGPLLFSPLSEIPSIGRLPMYIAPFVFYFAVNFGAIFTPTFGGLLATRFLTGFLASPALATGAGTVADILDPLHMPFGLCVWVVAAYQGPGIGPVVTGFAVRHFGSWRWSLGIHQMFSATALALIFVGFPETSGPNILLHRAQRLRRLTGNDKLRSQGEIDQVHLSVSAVVSEAIYRPFEITIKDPSILYCNLYVSLLYAFYYLFFAAFPIIFFEEYGFNIAIGELPYLSIAIGGCIFCAMYMSLYHFIVVPAIMANGPGEPEDALVPALPASVLSAVSLFAVGWSAGRTHWIASCIFTAIFAGANFVVLQPIFAYLAMGYPRYAASLFAANDAMRSTFAFGFLIAGTPLFRHLGIGPGVSLVAGLTALCVPGIFILRFHGKKLRMRSKFAQH